MEWLLGGGATVGVVGVVVLGIYLAKMAGDNRRDLHKLVQSGKDLADARRDNDGYRRSVEERDQAIERLEKQLASSEAALTEARESLANSALQLAAGGNASRVATSINGALKRLSEMSPVPEAEAPEGGDGH